jgi:hypothetical protein
VVLFTYAIPMAHTTYEDLKMNQPTLNSAFTAVYALLGNLLDSAVLDLGTEAKDCLEVFDQYDWEMADGQDAARFNQLKAMGDEGKMSLAELDEFMGMVAEHGQTHIYHTIVQGKKAIANLHGMNQATLLADTSGAEEYRAVAINIAHLTKADTKAFDLAISGGETMLMKREYGYFLKLFEHDEGYCFAEGTGNNRHGVSDQCKAIIEWAYNAGYRMIEFDCDAPAIDLFPVFEW